MKGFPAAWSQACLDELTFSALVVLDLSGFAMILFCIWTGYMASFYICPGGMDPRTRLQRKQ